MSTFGVWSAILMIGAVTFAYRLSFIVLFDRLSVPDWLRRGLRFVPIAALSAIILPELVVRAGVLNLSPLNPRMLAGLVAMAVAVKTRNVLATIIVGMLALWLLQALLG